MIEFVHDATIKAKNGSIEQIENFFRIWKIDYTVTANSYSEHRGWFTTTINMSRTYQATLTEAQYQAYLRLF